MNLLINQWSLTLFQWYFFVELVIFQYVLQKSDKQIRTAQNKGPAMELLLIIFI